MTDLQTAFQETGTQLDRIIEAFERKKPEWPRYAAFNFDYDIPTCYKIQQDLTIDCLNGYGGENGLCCIADSEDSNIVKIYDYWDDSYWPEHMEDYEIFRFDRTTFELTATAEDDARLLTWLDPYASPSQFTKVYFSSIYYNDRDIGIVGAFDLDKTGWHAIGDYSQVNNIEFGTAVSSIYWRGSYTYTNLSSMTIPSSVTAINAGFGANYLPNLSSITFVERTKSQVQAMAGYSWGLQNNPGTTIYCTDGSIAF